MEQVPKRSCQGTKPRRTPSTASASGGSMGTTSPRPVPSYTSSRRGSTTSKQSVASRSSFSSLSSEGLPFDYFLENADNLDLTKSARFTARLTARDQVPTSSIVPGWDPAADLRALVGSEAPVSVRRQKIGPNEDDDVLSLRGGIKEHPTLHKPNTRARMTGSRSKYLTYLQLARRLELHASRTAIKTLCLCRDGLY